MVFAAFGDTSANSVSVVRGKQIRFFFTHPSDE